MRGFVRIAFLCHVTSIEVCEASQDYNEHDDFLVSLRTTKQFGKASRIKNIVMRGNQKTEQRRIKSQKTKDKTVKGSYVPHICQSLSVLWSFSSTADNNRDGVTFNKEQRICNKNRLDRPALEAGQQSKKTEGKATENMNHLQEGSEPQLRVSLCELQQSLINHLILNYQRRMEFQTGSFPPEQTNETYRTLNWENPGKVEYQTVMEILRQQKQLLQQDFQQGRDTSLNHLLLDILRSLWKYLLFNSRRREALRPNVTRVNSHREWGELDQRIPLLRANLPLNVQEGDTIFKQHLRIILNYLKHSTPVQRSDSDSTRYNEDQEFDILNANRAL